MKNNLAAFICFLVLSAIGQSTYSQNCLITASNDTTIGCGGCANLSCTILPVNAPTGYTVANIPYTPYSFTTGTGVILGDDQWSGIINIPFPFCFYGTTYNQCLIGSNGAVSFNLAAAGGYCTWPINAAQNWPNLTPTDHRTSIGGPWQDLYLPSHGTIRYTSYGTAPCRVFVVSWFEDAMYGCNGNWNTQQICLYETTNIIDVNILQRLTCSWNGGRAVEAIQNNGTAAVVVPGRNAANANWTANNDGKRWTPNGPPNATVAWFNGATQIGVGNSITVCPLTTTTYTATVTLTGCAGPPITSSDQVVVTAAGSPFTSTVTSQTDVLCNGGSTGSATIGNSGSVGPFTYNWSTVPAQSTSTGVNLAAGGYTVTVTDQGTGCFNVVAVTILQPSALSVIMSNTPSLCNGAASGSVTVVPGGGVGGYTYNWNTVPAQTGSTAVAVPAGNYTVTVTDANGCTITGSTVVSQPASLLAVLTITGVSCFGGSDGSISVATNGGTAPYTQVWSTVPAQTGVIATGLSSGNYSVTVTDANGCNFIGSGFVPTPTLLQVSLNITPNTCQQLSNGFIQAVVTGGTAPFTYVWNTTPVQNTQTVVGLNQGSYTVIVTDGNGCSATANGVIISPFPVTVTTTGTTSMCYGETANIAAYGAGGTLPYVYSWTAAPIPFNASTQQITVSPQFGTNYYITITDANGCQGTVMHQLDVHELPVPSFIADQNTGCDTLVVTFTNNSAFGATYLWNFGDGTTSTDVNPTHTFTNGTYSITLTVTTAFGCVASELYPGYVTVIPGPVAMFTAIEDMNIPYVLSSNIFHFLNQSMYGNGMHWDFGDGNVSTTQDPIYSYTSADTFFVILTVTNDYGCTDEEGHQIIIVPDGQFFIPNIFTPNGDGHNDIFQLWGASVVEYNIEIFDRWGKLTYLSNDINSGWNGKMDDFDAPEGVYTWKIVATFQDGHNYIKGGTITLVR